MGTLLLSVSNLARPALVAGASALCLALFLVLTRRWHGQFSMDTHGGIQKFHTDPTPRIGGVAVFGGLICAYAVSPSSLQSLLGPLLLAGIPAFAFGLLEDITKNVGVGTRLLATMLCGVVGWAITGFSLTRVNVPGLDWMLGYTIVSLAFTAFAVGGVANAINIIDGFNGLASGTAIVILCGFAALSGSVGDVTFAYLCLVLAGATCGFFLLNWPFGKMFLGDGGAYFLGFALAWAAVLFLARHPQVSAWQVLLVCAYPILEVCFSVLRRRRRGLSPGAPDRLHLHSLVKQRLVRQRFSQRSNLWRNSATGILMCCVSAVPVVVALALPADNFSMAIGLFLCAGAYWLVYARLSQFHWCLGAAAPKCPVPTP